MKYMVGYPIMVVICYLAFAFIAFDLYPGNWSETYRILCAVFTAVWGTALSYRISQDCKWSY